MAVHELNPGTIFTLDSSSGQIAPRKFSCDTLDEVVQLCRDLAAWPLPLAGFEACWPISISAHPFNDTMAPTGAGGDKPYLSSLPTYSTYLVVAQYHLLHNYVAMNSDADDAKTTTWPDCIARPQHYTGTTLSLRIRNSGQFLTMPGKAGYVAAENGTPIVSLSQDRSFVQLIPIQEFHLTCDRLTAVQVPDAKLWEGHVNESTYMGCDPGTLLFETGELDHSYAPDIDNPCRFRFTCVIRRRMVIPKSGHLAGVTLGWNYEYHDNVPRTSPGEGPGWYRVKLNGGADRYPLRDFTTLFGTL